ncbi:MAG TPA: hemerythrin domain-containing protein [Methanomicrobiales archaeon]|nr:hemerythrin domain-containing protein [Methanomicrobiales archaeon]
MAEDLLDILKRQHDELLSGISDLLEEEREPEKGERNLEFDRLHRLFLEHTHGEEEVFYPALRDHMARMVRGAMDEHDIIVDRMGEMATQWYGGYWDNLLRQLKGKLEYHVSMEEHAMFETARKLYSPEQLEEMGRAFLEAEEKTPGVRIIPPEQASASR